MLDNNIITGKINNLKDSIKQAEHNLSALKDKKLVEENNLQHAKNDLKSIEEECKQLGINPDDLQNIINNKLNEIDNMQQKINSVIASINGYV